MENGWRVVEKRNEPWLLERGSSLHATVLILKAARLETLHQLTFLQLLLLFAVELFSDERSWNFL